MIEIGQVLSDIKCLSGQSELLYCAFVYAVRCKSCKVHDVTDIACSRLLVC